MADNGQLTWSNDTRRLGDLIAWEHNPRQLTEKQAAGLTESLRKFGLAQPLLVSPGGDIYDGHQRDNVMRLMGEYGADAAVDVRVSSRELTYDERREIAIRLHKNIGEFDFDVLPNLFDAEELVEWGFEDWELDLSGWDSPEEADADPQFDRAEELREQWGVESGDLWRLPSRHGGEHRLVCGDCTDAGVVERVMDGQVDAVVCDPPYGVGVAYGAFDDSEDNARNLIQLFMPKLLALECPVAIASGQRLMWDYPRPAWVMAWVHPAGMGANPWGFTQFNPILVYGKCPYLARGLGSRPDSIVMAVDREGESVHPTSKPIKLWEWLVERITPERGEVVYDPFGGSGTTMVACENLGRSCRMIEIEPSYCAVILQRMVDAFGIEPERIS